MKTLWSVGAVAAVLFVTGCSNVESEDVMTSGVYADIRASADGSGVTQVRTSLRVGGATSNTFLDLEGDDRLEATHAASTQEMAREEILGAVSYVTSFPVDAADASFQVAFLRTVDEGAPSSIAVLPAPFAITAPAAETTFSRTADVSLTWDDAGSADTLSWVASGDCVQMRSGNIAGDPGVLVLPAGTFVAHENQQDVTCNVTVTLVRARAGTLDPNYGEGGSVRGEQRRRIEIRSAP